MVNCIGFEPFVNSKSKILVLGSMPGMESLAKQQYYGHPRNAFWYIMHILFKTGTLEVPYLERVNSLMNQGVALWDVIQSCERPGSLDSRILAKSIVVNDFNSLLAKYPNVKAIFCNGQKSYGLFNKHVLPTLKKDIAFHKLPSTSPAHASLSLSEKAEAWSIIKNYL